MDPAAERWRIFSAFQALILAALTTPIHLCYGAPGEITCPINMTDTRSMQPTSTITSACGMQI